MSTTTKTLEKSRVSLSKKLVDLLNEGNWEELYEYIVQLREDGDLFTVFPEMKALDEVSSAGGTTHKNVLDHTFEVLANLRDLLAREYAEKGEDYYDVDDNPLILGALLHDIGKPATKRFDKEKRTWTFYRHEEVGWQMLPAIFKRFANDGCKIEQTDQDVISIVVRYHQLPSQLESVGDKGLRRFLKKCEIFDREVLLMSRADITSANPMKVLRGRKKVDLLEEKIKEFHEREKLRLLRVDISNQDIAYMLGMEPKEAAKIKTKIKELVSEGRLVNERDQILKWIKGEQYGTGNDQGKSDEGIGSSE